MKFSQAPLAALALASPAWSAPKTFRHGSGCTSVSFSDDFSWKVDNLDYHSSYIYSTPSHQISSGTVSFDITNPSVKTRVHCEGTSDRISDFFYGDVSYPCKIVSKGGAEEVVPTSFKFNAPVQNGASIEIEDKWECHDGSVP